ncbi:hypothetical protein HPB50_018617 [Hyalomma asiaticum]|uniref:Uncharacterized protein n=1 Tax=Hyalomma asiaticum TaxID=266040 RepID=A0ACB7SL65_HYAAI|nr:hypothetical protein HPB50_018617 [Hyalomma asiaticum]
MAPRNSGSGERPPTRRPQKRPGGRALQKHGPVTPMQRRESERRSVATWTHQQGTEAPRYFHSDTPWKAHWQVRRDLPVDRVPWTFRGCTVTEVDAAAQGAQLPAQPEAVLCAECRGTVFHNSHYEGRRHAPRAGPAADGGGRAGEVTTLGDAELAAFCLRRLRDNPRFAALLTASAEPSPAQTVTEAGARDTADAVRADQVLTGPLTSIELKDTLNLNRDPCKNFYEYACSLWPSRYPVPDDMGHYSVHDLLRDEVAKRIFGILRVLSE